MLTFLPRPLPPGVPFPVSFTFTPPLTPPYPVGTRSLTRLTMSATARADCTDCSWSFSDTDTEAVSDALEAHSRKEHHHVEFRRVQAASA